MNLSKDVRNILVVSVPCYDFLNENGIREKRNVIIAPIKIRVEGDTYLLSYSCSRALSCHDPECRYSKGVPVVPLPRGEKVEARRASE